MVDQRYREQAASEVAALCQFGDAVGQSVCVGPLAEASQADTDAFGGAGREDGSACAQVGDLVEIVQSVEVDQ
ncbi:hypothetical protein [Micromonospora sp. NPDC049374]|uniref:hypothetical protein n=1 Tax=Micromonospora sp. NPDC049374 TaxID=3154352 RepID=UPI003426DD67